MFKIKDIPKCVVPIAGVLVSLAAGIQNALTARLLSLLHIIMSNDKFFKTVFEEYVRLQGD